ncbi:helix-turn-helix domain-containing protein [Thalassobaculum salexigens]|uniref:helix-turn-helix domain-containing protein n=1 Tax=Thalassobaculum salexigens TaxID=455360 RepID=UPI00146C0B57|nr:helix-turn-helix transcriptional regulator [Thalassobaculum salexigens]
MQGLAERLREARHRLGLTQADLAERLGIPYRTLQDGERGLSLPGAKILEAYARQNVDINWLLTGIAVRTNSGRPSKTETPTLFDRPPIPIKGRRFRIRSRKLVRIPHYDPLDPDGFDPDNPDSVLTIDPSRLVAYNIDYALLGREDAELATTTVINERASKGLKKGTLVLFDTSMRREISAGRLIAREHGSLIVSLEAFGDQVEAIVGKVVYVLSNA